MKKLIIGVLIFTMIISAYTRFSLLNGTSMNYMIKNEKDIVRLFAITPDQLQDRIDTAKKQTTDEIMKILAIPDADRSWENTVIPFDHAARTTLGVIGNVAGILNNVSKDEAIRAKAQQAMIDLEQVAIDLLVQNVAVYHAFKAYVEGNAQRESLTPEQRYFLQELMKGFKNNGLDLPEEKRTQVKQLQKELAALGIEFEKNISDDNRSITVTRDELAGLGDEFIATLQRTADGSYILGTDYPTYFMVIEHGEYAPTRERLWREFQNRAHPKNTMLLKTIIEKRDELAHLLGFKSYAHLNLDEEMVKTPERAYEFLNNLITKAQIKEDQEIKRLLTDVPPSVKPSAEGKLHPWDLKHLSSQYKKKHYNLDDREIAQYFPLGNTIKELLAIYEQFMNLRLVEEPISGLWDEDVRLIKVYKKGDGILVGYLLLDLFPRPFKFTHACQMTAIPAQRYSDGVRRPALVVVLANFTKPTVDKPSLLKFDEVNTFFHEFGHALHAILSQTDLASTSGTNVKTDFVEMPSQMLEEWLWDPKILKQVSSHYQTGQHLPETLINKIIELKNFESGYFVTRQCFLALLSLNYFAKEVRSIDEVYRTLYQKTRKHMMYDPDDHIPASFGHLMGYGARYYGYLWSKVYALDLFNFIKQYGLLNADIGTRYVETILEKGGSVDPNILLRNFLGREPNQQAFLNDLGL